MVRLLMLFSLCWAITAQAAVYQWVDEQGRMHYGEEPPDNTAREVTVPENRKPRAGPAGLSRDEQRWINSIERREQQQRKANQQEAQRLEREQERVEQANAAKCRRYSRLVDEYQDKLRAGCSPARCVTYQQRLDGYREEAAVYCQ